ncbi:YraN family protein [Candidatus Dependentiae bacterium]|nr:MAG: YraN family protein [Candidatus Dependentiae bacterium]
MTIKKNYNVLFGSWAEEYVSVHLQEKEFLILHKNYRKMVGEIDIIAQKKDLLIFVEVKARKAATVPLEEIILTSKQKKIIATAKHFLMSYKQYNSVTVRFDVALVDHTKEGIALSYIENAFQTDDE